MPGAVEASKYVEYGTWADDTSVCMGPALARLDDHVEATAEFMAVSLPTAELAGELDLSLRYVAAP